MRAVNHDSLLLLLLLQLLLNSLDVLSIEVGAAGSTTENDEPVWVTSSLGDSSKTLLGDTHEVVLGGSRSNGINSDGQRAISSVLEADWEGKTRGELAVKLGLGGAGSNGTEGDEVSKELWGDGVQHLRGNWHADRGEVAEELAGNAKTLVDLVRLIDIWIVDQTLPSDGCAWLLEVGAHDNAEVAGELLGEGLQARAVLERGGWIVDGAWADDDQEAVVLAHDNLDGILATLDDGLESRLGDWDLGEEKLWWDQWILTENCIVVTH